MPAVLLAVHGLIHLMGFAKAFGASRHPCETIAFGCVRIAAHGEARWTLPEGEFTYGEFDLQEVRYNVRTSE